MTETQLMLGDFAPKMVMDATVLPTYLTISRAEASTIENSCGTTEHNLNTFRLFQFDLRIRDGRWPEKTFPTLGYADNEGHYKFFFSFHFKNQVD